MVDLSTVDHIFLYPGVTDLRKGRVTLRHMACEIAKDDHLHKLFLFCQIIRRVCRADGAAFRI